MMHRIKWGLIFSGIYLLVCIPCILIYLANRHEYSLPLLIVYYASLPTHYLLYEILYPVAHYLEQLPHGETLG